MNYMVEVFNSKMADLMLVVRVDRLTLALSSSCKRGCCCLRSGLPPRRSKSNNRETWRMSSSHNCRCGQKTQSFLCFCKQMNKNDLSLMVEEGHLFGPIVTDFLHFIEVA